MELYFLNKLDTAIFKHLNPAHQAVTGTTAVHAFIGGAIISLIVFVMQMCTNNDTLIEVVAAIGLLALAGWVINYSLLTLKAFSGWGGRIAYGAYVLFLAYLAFMIAMWTIMIALVGLFMYGIFKIFFSSGSSSKSSHRRQQEVPQEEECDATIKDENGYERKLWKNGFGGFRDDKGDFWKSNGDGTVTRDNS
ncbi:hypothetical protein [Bacteroides sp.]|uniref:hypothetical protein n=1 Tax=Bacteroides sp. TaxID=29523 RepID=UPI0025BDF52D|nr:hypothetical protein [Bacteroides sp.]